MSGFRSGAVALGLLSVVYSSPGFTQEVSCQFPGVGEIVDFSQWGKESAGSSEVSEDPADQASFILKKTDWTLGLVGERQNASEFFDQLPKRKPLILGPGLVSDAFRILSAQHSVDLRIVDSPEGLGKFHPVRISGSFWDDMHLIASLSDRDLSLRLNQNVVEVTLASQWEISWSRLEDGLFLDYFLEGFLSTELHRDAENKKLIFVGNEQVIRQVSQQLDLFVGMRLVPVSGSLWRVPEASLDDLVGVLGDTELVFGQNMILARVSDSGSVLQSLGAEYVDDGNLVFPILSGIGLDFGPVCGNDDILSFFASGLDLILTWGNREVALAFSPGEHENSFFGSPFLLAKVENPKNPEILVLAFSGFAQ